MSMPGWGRPPSLPYAPVTLPRAGHVSGRTATTTCCFRTSPKRKPSVVGSGWAVAGAATTSASRPPRTSRRGKRGRVAGSEDLGAPRRAIGAEERVGALDRTGAQLLDAEAVRELAEREATEVRG